jgi:hypothetical protein
VHLHCVSDSVTDMDGIIRIDRLPLGHDTDRETDISLASSSHPLGSLYYPDIAFHISNYYIIIVLYIHVYLIFPIQLGSQE